MVDAKYYHIADHRPVVICFSNPEAYEKFLRCYQPHIGFFVEKVRSDKYAYKLYVNGYVFFADTYERDWDKQKLGFYVKSRDHFMTQRQTIHTLTKCLQVFGLQNKYIIPSDNRRITNLMSAQGFHDLKGALDQVRNVPAQSWDCEQHKAEKEKEDAERQRMREAVSIFYPVQLALLEEERAYRRAHFFSFSYDRVETVSQRNEEGVIYSFHISVLLPDELQRKLKMNTAVEISRADGKPIYAVVVKFNACDNTLLMKVHATERSQIPDSGQVVERENVSYRHVNQALLSIKHHTAENSFLEKLLLGENISPIPESDVFSDRTFNEKQREAINRAIATEDFLLIQGPPGTGKTRIIIEMVAHFVKNGQRVLICSQNNHAVDNVLEKCVSLRYPTEQQQPIHCLRIGDAGRVETQLRGNLLRPLTQTIQHAMQKRSREAAVVYAQQRMAGAVQVEAILEKHRPLFVLLEKYSQVQNYCVRMSEAFPRRFLEFFHTPQYLKDARQKAKDCAVIATEAVNVLVSLINGKPAPDLYVHLQRLREALMASMAELKEAINRKGFLKIAFMASNSEQVVTDLEGYFTVYGAVISQGMDHIKNDIDIGVTKHMPKQQMADPAQAYRFRAEDYAQRMHQWAQRQEAQCASMKKDLEAWSNVLQNDDKSIGEALMKSIKIVGATCIGSSTKSHFNELRYDVVIVDEAGQIPMHNLLVPLVKAKKFILVGDHIQLPPQEEREMSKHLKTHFVPAMEAKYNPEGEKNLFAPFTRVDQFYSMSLFEVLFNRKEDGTLSNHTVMLSEQYRCHSQIADFVSRHFYENEYRSLKEIDAARQIHIAGFQKPMYFVDTVHMADKAEKQLPGSKSHYNPAEAQLCAQYVCDMVIQIRKDPEKYKDLIDEHGHYDIGVITGYGDQVAHLIPAIKQCILQALGGSAAAADEANLIMARISVDTLDSFQGMEKQIILFSCVRSNKAFDVGFLSDTRRINVLMTRAKSLLILIGDSKTLQTTSALAKHNNAPVADILKDYIDICKDAQTYIDPTGKYTQEKGGGDHGG